MEDDGHPCAPKAVGGVGVQQAGEDRVRYPPGLVYVIEAEEHAVGHPAPASEHAFHPGQEHAPEEELLPQDRVERGVNHEQGEEPPGALQPRQDLLRLEDRAGAVALRAPRGTGRPTPRRSLAESQRRVPPLATATRNGTTHNQSLARGAPVAGSRGALSRSLRLTVAQRRSPSS